MGSQEGLQVEELEVGRGEKQVQLRVRHPWGVELQGAGVTGGSCRVCGGDGLTSQLPGHLPASFDTARLLFYD